MYDIYSFIDSETIRDYNRLIKTEFTPLEQAVIIKNSEKTTVYEKLSAWKELLSAYSEKDFQTAPLPVERLRNGRSNKKYIENTVKEYEAGLSLTEKSENYIFNAYLEDMMNRYGDENICTNEQYFSSYKKAYDYLCRLRKKYYLYDDTRPNHYYGIIIALQLDEPKKLEAEYTLDNSMRLIDIHCRGKDIDDGIMFNITVPMPFKKGDIVRNYDGLCKRYAVISQNIDEDYYNDPENDYGIFGKAIHYHCIDDYEDKETVSTWYWDMFPLMLEFCPDDELPENESRLIRLREELLND